MPAPVASPALDICRAFGPLASMHAALDREGGGMPCGIVARFVGRTSAEVDRAIGEARLLFPVLGTRLAWHGNRPILLPCDERARVDGGDIDPAECGHGDVDGVSRWLALSAADGGPVWRYRLVQIGRDTWFQATWLHAVADGNSMLRFLRAIAEAAGMESDGLHRSRPASRVRPMAMARWLPGFLLQQRGGKVRLAERSRATCETSWCVVPPGERDRILAGADAARCGMAAWLAAAVARSFAAREGRPSGRISLNVPIARGSDEEAGGFGFASGSLRMPVTLRPGEPIPALARRIGRRIRQQAANGWDRNLERLLGPDPARHARFAAIETRRAPDPNLTVSWKGYRPAQTIDGIADVACFAAAPTLHVSAHADAHGFSLSVTSRQSSYSRRLLLQAILHQLGGDHAVVIHDFAGLEAVRDMPTVQPETA